MVKIVGHRGAGEEAPQNTLLSFQTAIEIGCDRAELDVHLSKDNVVVVIHDEEVSKTTDGQGHVRDLTLAELKKLSCEQGQKIPTLEEVIRLCKGKIDLQIELKGLETPRYVCELIEKYGLIYSAQVTSFDVNLLREIKQLNSQINAGILLSKEPSEEIWKLATEMKLSYLCPAWDVVTRELVERAHREGMKVYAWRVNDQERYERVLNLGVDDIGTDFPRMFIN